MAPPVIAWDEKGNPISGPPAASGATTWDEQGNPVSAAPLDVSKVPTETGGAYAAYPRTSGKDVSGADALARASGFERAPRNDRELKQMMGQSLGKEGAYVSAPYMAAIPGPGEGGSLAMQMLKGGGYGAGIGALEHGLSNAWRGELPDIEGTLKAAGTGGLMGAVLGPAMNIPAVQKTIRSIPYLKRFLPEAEESPGWEPFKPANRPWEASVPTAAEQGPATGMRVAVPKFKKINVAEPMPEEPADTIDYAANRKMNMRALKAPTSSEPIGPATGAQGKVIPKFKQIEATREAGQIPVLHAPEPNPLAPGEKPGSMYSIPREELAAAAQRSKPGAIDVLRDLGRPMIVIPKEAGYPGPRIPAIEEEETPQLLRRAAD